MNEELRRMDDERIARLEERVNNWMETTTQYRKALCAKLDVILERMNALPCRERAVVVESVKSDVRWLQKVVWTIMLMGVPALLGLAVAWGALNTTVQTNTQKWKAFDEVTSKEVEQLKERSKSVKDLQIVLSREFQSAINSQKDSV